MQEDTVGTTPTLRSEYGTCAECGAAFRRSEAQVAATGLTDDGRSEYTELCPDCYKLGLQGERPVIGDVQP